MSERAVESKIRETRTARRSSWKKTKKCQRRCRRGYCYSGRGSESHFTELSGYQQFQFPPLPYSTVRYIMRKILNFYP
ncbi:hypothetical protein TNCV_3214881 [Trichonephila clavipes]|nr:hypothetical protein TNCV_3214881 [Trichonephila clavipes]